MWHVTDMLEMRSLTWNTINWSMSCKLPLWGSSIGADLHLAQSRLACPDTSAVHRLWLTKALAHRIDRRTSCCEWEVVQLVPTSWWTLLRCGSSDSNWSSVGRAVVRFSSIVRRVWMPWFLSSSDIKLSLSFTWVSSTVAAAWSGTVAKYFSSCRDSRCFNPAAAILLSSADVRCWLSLNKVGRTSWIVGNFSADKTFVATSIGESMAITSASTSSWRSPSRCSNFFGTCRSDVMALSCAFIIIIIIIESYNKYSESLMN